MESAFSVQAHLPRKAAPDMSVPRIAMLFALAALGACAGRQAPTATPSKGAPAPTRQQRIHTALAQSVRVVVADEGRAARSASGVALAGGSGAGGAVSYIVTNAHVVQPRQGEEPRYFVLVDLPSGQTQEHVAKLEALGQVPEA
ncbi:MAG TPA: hypothetical protein DFS52_10710, partial [Myxococcales bacterium]|nr:hypothetical protein [Myxococcales bacterium]